MLEIKRGILIDERDLVFKRSRSSGPGGQNVNKVNTQVMVWFDVVGCENLTEYQKRRILRRLATRANKAGQIRVACGRYRTQNANRRAVLERLRELLWSALEEKAARRKTLVPKKSKRSRLDDKKKRGVLKKLRGQVGFEL